MIPIIIAVGFTGIVAQVLLLRELLVSFYGNELVIGVILGNWLACEGLGAYLAGKFADTFKQKARLIFTLQALFSIFLPISLYFCRTFKGAIGLAPGEAAGLASIILVSFLVVFPVSFCHGALFSLLCNVYNSIGMVYTWETAGTSWAARV